MFFRSMHKTEGKKLIQNTLNDGTIVLYNVIFFVFYVHTCSKRAGGSCVGKICFVSLKDMNACESYSQNVAITLS